LVMAAATATGEEVAAVMAAGVEAVGMEKVSWVGIAVAAERVRGVWEKEMAAYAVAWKALVTVAAVAMAADCSVASKDKVEGGAVTAACSAEEVEAAVVEHLGAAHCPVEMLAMVAAPVAWAEMGVLAGLQGAGWDTQSLQSGQSHKTGNSSCLHLRCTQDPRTDPRMPSSEGRRSTAHSVPRILVRRRRGGMSWVDG
jgi:hypothetical protein